MITPDKLDQDCIDFIRAVSIRKLRAAGGKEEACARVAAQTFELVEEHEIPLGQLEYRMIDGVCHCRCSRLVLHAGAEIIETLPAVRLEHPPAMFMRYD